MSDCAGIRVMRGPNWADGDVDGGEGHLGTLKELLTDQQVRVQWDNGQVNNYRAGTDGKYDLRIFDLAQIGVRHPGSRCSGCDESDFYGMLWRCAECENCDLCSRCYSEDMHDIRHDFLRLDHYKSQGQSVKKRKVSVRMRSMGTFPGATVIRGPDWAWGDQDGGSGSTGEVEFFENVAPNSSRNLMRVNWKSGNSNSYRMGYAGFVDLTCTEEEVGPFYYRDHLPLLDAAMLPYPLAPLEAFTAVKSPAVSTSAASSSTPCNPSTSSKSSIHSNASSSATNASYGQEQLPVEQEQLPVEQEQLPVEQEQLPVEQEQLPVEQEQLPVEPQRTDENQNGGEVCGWEATPMTSEDLSFRVGDWVVIGVNENKLRDLQEDCGGLSDSMIKMMGQKGKVTQVATGVLVRFTSVTYRFNPLALVKLPVLKEGDVIRVSPDVEQVKLLNKKIAWNDQIAETCGVTGRVVSVDKDDTVTVTFGHYQTFRYFAACCLPAPGATVDPVGAVGAAVGARRALGAQKEAAADAPGVSVYRNDEESDTAKTQTQGSDGSDSDRDILRKILGLMSGSGSTRDSNDTMLRVLFSAISKGDSQAVEQLVRGNRSLLTKTHQSLTPLMYACYDGQRRMVTRLLELGADVNARNEKKRSALLVALDRKEQDIALLLLQRGADPLVANHRKRSALHEAAYEDLPEALQMLISLGADVNATDEALDTPLFDAIEKGNQGIVRILLSVPDLNVDHLNRKGFNMLQLSALRGHAGCMEAIISSERRPDVDDLLLGEYSALHIAANNDHVECVGILVLLGGANVNIRDGRRLLTTLHLACKRRQLKSAEALIGLGASVNMCDVEGNTPLHLAVGKILEGNRDDSDVSLDTAIKQRTELACMLISKGARVDLVDEEGRSPLSYGRSQVQDNVKLFLQQNDFDLTGLQDTAVEGAASTSVGIGGLKVEIMNSKPDDEASIDSLLQRVSVQCAQCDATAEVTLLPCGHKSVCRKCCENVKHCPTCHQPIEDRIPDNRDEEDDETEQGNEMVENRIH